MTETLTLVRGGAEHWKAWDAADAARRECEALKRANSALERRAEEAEARRSRLAARAASDEELVKTDLTLGESAERVHAEGELGEGGAAETE